MHFHAAIRPHESAIRAGRRVKDKDDACIWARTVYLVGEAAIYALSRGLAAARKCCVRRAARERQGRRLNLSANRALGRRCGNLCTFTRPCGRVTVHLGDTAIIINIKLTKN